MSWRGTIRTLNAAANRYERAQRRQQRENERQQKALQKLTQQQEALLEFEQFQQEVKELISIHKTVPEQWEWESILQAAPPVEPQKSRKNEKNAKEALANYKPSLIDNVLNRSEQRKEELELEVKEALKKDAQEHERRFAKYEQKLSDFTEKQNLAQGVINKSPEALRLLFVEYCDLGNLIEIGPEPSIRVTAKAIYANVTVKSNSIVPSEQKVLLKSGKLSAKQMPKSLYFEIYKAYVCGAAIRVAREIFAAVPETMAIVSVYCNQLNPRSGHLEATPILSVAIANDTLQQLNVENVEPSACLENFIHKLNFSKTKGFSPLSEVIRDLPPQPFDG